MPEDFVQFIRGIIIFAGPAFALGWLDRKNDINISRRIGRRFDAGRLSHYLAFGKLIDLVIVQLARSSLRADTAFE